MVRNEKRHEQAQRNWFARFTRGLGLSLTSFGGRGSSESTSMLSSSQGESQNVPSPYRTSSVVHTTWAESNGRTALASANGSGEDTSRKTFPGGHLSLNSSAGTGHSTNGSGSFRVGQVPPTGNRQRLAGHTGRVRLEAPPVLETPSPMARQMISETPSPMGRQTISETPNPMTRQTISETPREILDIAALLSSPGAPAKTEMDIHPTQPARKEVQPLQLLARNALNKTGVGTQKHPAVSRMFKGNIRAATHDPLYGSGEFDCGQRDAIIKHPAIRASSVVIVMLTSNPGPVVVQYVSLLPHESFTVHLTAPATMHAQFNYMIFSGESA